ncbi:MAG: DedA family protein [Ignavibacteriae bacterium]|nr:DedA family protein [Ignavibacteriota bacterium]
MFESLHSLDAAIEFLSHLEWYWVLGFAFFITMLENIFPPSPSDSVLVFMGSLISLGTIGFIPLLLLATAGSLVGFMIMFYLGNNFGNRLVASSKMPFINEKDLEKPEEWFRKWGYYLIIANRFLSGTRAVISFFAGLSDLDFKKTVVLSAISALIWNSILIYLGVVFGNNFEAILEYLSLYGKIIFPLIGLAIVVFLVKKYWWDKRKAKIIG